MKLLDVNVVLAAHREAHALYGAARPWLDELLRAGVRFSVLDSVAGSFVRLATDRKVFPDPTTLGEAFSYLRSLRDQPSHVPLSPGPRHLDLLEQICRDADATGDLVPDAQLVAVAVEHGAEVVSFDRDFARFPDLRWSRP